MTLCRLLCSISADRALIFTLFCIKMKTPTPPEVPTNVPGLVEIKKLLPKHCFQPTLAQSIYYVIKDVIIVSLLFVTYVSIENSELSFVAKWICAPFYWYLQGTMFWAIFVLGHDCGHGSFSKYNWFNDILGTLLHR